MLEVIGEYDDRKLITSEFNPNPLKVVKSQGRKAYDVVRLQDVFNFLISVRLINGMTKSNLTGWKTYNIDSGNFLSGYSGFQCIGKCGKPKRPRETGFVTNFKFDIDTWDGSDFFIPESTLMIICTEKAKEVIESFKIKNIEFENIETLEYYNI